MPWPTLLAATRVERAHLQVQLARGGVDRHVDVTTDDRLGGMGGDRVADQHGVGEPVHREPRAGREHRRHPAEYRCGEGAGGDRYDRLAGGRLDLLYRLVDPGGGDFAARVKAHAHLGPLAG